MRSHCVHLVGTRQRNDPADDRGIVKSALEISGKFLPIYRAETLMRCKRVVDEEHPLGLVLAEQSIYSGS